MNILKTVNMSKTVLLHPNIIQLIFKSLSVFLRRYFNLLGTHRRLKFASLWGPKKIAFRLQKVIGVKVGLENTKN